MTWTDAQIEIVARAIYASDEEQYQIEHAPVGAFDEPPDTPEPWPPFEQIAKRAKARFLRQGKAALETVTSLVRSHEKMREALTFVRDQLLPAKHTNDLSSSGKRILEKVAAALSTEALP